MADFTDATESKIIQHIVGEATWTAPAGTFVQLHDGDPGETGVANVLADMGGRLSATWDAEAAGVAALAADLEWTNVSGGSVTVSHVSVWDTAGTGNPPTGGECVMKGALNTSKVVPDTEIFRLEAGNLTLGAD